MDTKKDNFDSNIGRLLKRLTLILENIATVKNRYDYVIIPCADGCYSSPPRFLTNTDILRVCHGFSLIILLPYKVLLLQVKYFGVEVCVLGSNTAGIPMFAYSVCSASPALG